MASARKSNTLFAVAVLLGVVGSAEGALFSTLSKTLTVTASRAGSNSSLAGSQVHSGIDTILVSWALNSSAAPGVDAAYKKIATKLCFAPVSQVDRKWRKFFDDSTKDKTCSFAMTTQPYSHAGNTTHYLVAKNVPGAFYFVRAYALDAAGNQVAYGQTTNKNRTTNIFTVVPITGRHASIDIAVALFSLFSIGSLLGFFAYEKLILQRKKRV